MGLDLALIRFLDQTAASSGLSGPMLALGSLEINDKVDSIAEYARKNSYTKLSADHSVASLMSERFGIERYLSCDINDLADIHLDLGQPLPEEHRQKFHSILNGGTLEHVFDFRQAMETVHDATIPGGVMVHICPSTWFDHGFFNLNPVLFHLVAEANDYEVVAEGFHFSEGTWEGQTRSIVGLLGVDETVPDWGFPMDKVFKGKSLPRDSCHLISLRKKSDQPFQVPIQKSF